MNTPSDAKAPSDEAQVRWLIERYFFAIDSKDASLMRSCFAEDVKIVYHSGESREVRLPDREAVLTYLQAGIAWNGPSIHALSSSVVTLKSADAAQVGTYAIAHLVTEGKVLVRGLRYDDQVVRQAGGWVIQRRDHRSIWQFDGQSVPSYVPART